MFARCSLAKGDVVVRYVGEVISVKRADEIELQREKVFMCHAACLAHRVT